MGYGPWAMGFNRSAARHYVLIGAARLAAYRRRRNLLLSYSACLPALPARRLWRRLKQNRRHKATPLKAHGPKLIAHSHSTNVAQSKAVIMYISQGGTICTH